MKATRFGGLALAVVILVGGCKPDDRERLSKVGRKLGDKAEVATAEATGQALSGWQTVRANLDEGDLARRVRHRLKWDKPLADVAIEVSTSGKEVRLSGLVPNLTLRRRAIELANSTVGVEKVIDELVVPTP